MSKARPVRELKAVSEEKSEGRVREPKIDGCEIFWRLRANLQTGCAYTTKSVNLTERIEPWFGG